MCLVSLYQVLILTGRMRNVNAKKINIPVFQNDQRISTTIVVSDGWREDNVERGACTPSLISATAVAGETSAWSRGRPRGVSSARSSFRTERHPRATTPPPPPQPQPGIAAPGGCCLRRRLARSPQSAKRGVCAEPEGGPRGVTACCKTTVCRFLKESRLRRRPAAVLVIAGLLMHLFRAEKFTR
jgi:hypothetical protein